MTARLGFEVSNNCAIAYKGARSMKTVSIICIFILVGIFSTAVAVGNADSAGQGSAAGAAPISNELLRAQYAAQLKKSEQESNEAHKRNMDLFARTEAMLSLQETMMSRQEKYMERYDKILATWERQQAQYQKYLDSLPKK